MESDLIAHGRSLLASKRSTDLVTYDTTSENDLLWGVGTGCHGVVKILLEVIDGVVSWPNLIVKTGLSRQVSYLETIWTEPDASKCGTRALTALGDAAPNAFVTTVAPPWHLVIFGAGDDAQPLVSLAATLGWDLSVIDPRQAMAQPSRFPAAQQVQCLPAETAATQLTWDDRTAAVIMTHHYRYDLPLLRTLVPLHLPFLGLLGPRERGSRLMRDAGLGDVTPGQLLRNPVGLDLGGDGAAAVALSIMAEIQATIHGRDARPLFQRATAIHHE